MVCSSSQHSSGSGKAGIGCGGSLAIRGVEVRQVMVMEQRFGGCASLITTLDDEQIKHIGMGTFARRAEANDLTAIERDSRGNLRSRPRCQLTLLAGLYVDFPQVEVLVDAESHGFDIIRLVGMADQEPAVRRPLGIAIPDRSSVRRRIDRDACCVGSGSSSAIQI
jgi:hypothetical protein